MKRKRSALSLACVLASSVNIRVHLLPMYSKLNLWPLAGCELKLVPDYLYPNIQRQQWPCSPSLATLPQERLAGQFSSKSIWIAV
jgi:hypothetical protein